MHFLERARSRSGWTMCSVPGARLPSLSAHTRDWVSITVLTVKMLELSVLVSPTSFIVFAVLHTDDHNAHFTTLKYADSCSSGYFVVQLLLICWYLVHNNGKVF